jgi:hypothetical protein
VSAADPNEGTGERQAACTFIVIEPWRKSFTIRVSSHVPRAGLAGGFGENRPYMNESELQN